MDAGTYAVARWGVERAAAQAFSVRHFPHHDASAARVLVQRDSHSGTRPIVVTDGFCPACGKAAPIAELLQCVERSAGVSWSSMTRRRSACSAKTPTPDAPYGRDGGGSLPWHGVTSPRVIAGSSLAKGFGVPLAVLCGKRARDPALRGARRHARAQQSAVDRDAARRRARPGRQPAGQGDGRADLPVATGRTFPAADCGRSVSRRQGGLFPVQTLSVGGVDARILHLRSALRRHPDRSCSLLPRRRSAPGLSHHRVASSGGHRSCHRSARSRIRSDITGEDAMNIEVWNDE